MNKYLQYSDIVLWLGLGLSIYALYQAKYSPSSAPEQTRQDSTPQAAASIDDVDSIHLYDLTRHPNQQIASTASRILCRRALNDPVTRNAIHADAHHRSYSIRSRAEKAIRLIRSFDRAAFTGHDGYSSCILLNEDSAYHRGDDRRSVDYYPENLVEYWDRPTTVMGETPSQARTNFNGDGATPRPRNRNNSPGERARRRRRREAIVLNEGDRPVTQQDIIQRRQTG